MNDIDKRSDQLLNKIMMLELKINSILTLNGNEETPEIKYYKKNVIAKKMAMNRLNDGYGEQHYV